MKKRILCFGDSNTWGYRPDTGERHDEDVRWTGRLQKLLGDDYTVIEEGQNGRTTVWDDPIENRLAGLTYLWPCMESQAPFDLIIIMLGTNDTKPYFSMTPRNIADAAGRLAEIAMNCPYGRDRKPPKVLLAAPIRIKFSEDLDQLFGEQAAEKSRDFSEAYKKVADEKGCYFFDASLYGFPSDIDGLHMEAEAHEKLALGFYEKVREIFSEV